MIKKKIIILFFFLISCGYQPLYKINNKSYLITDYNLSGDNQINKILKKNFTRYQKISNANKEFQINSKSEIIQITNSKNRSGTNSNLSIEIVINLEILNDKKLLKNVTFKESTNYNSLANKFELKQYEKILIKNLTNRILDRIHLNLSTIQ